jgi:hypothetical protein
MGILNLKRRCRMSEKKGFVGKLIDYMKERVLPEVGQMLEHKVAQGAAELGQAINSQADGYVPYGAGQAPLEVEGPTVSYQDMLRDASRGAEQEHDREGIDR